MFKFTSALKVNYACAGSLLLEADTRFVMIVCANTATRLIRFNKAITWLKRASAQVVALGAAQTIRARQHLAIRSSLLRVSFIIRNILWAKYKVSVTYIFSSDYYKYPFRNFKHL